MIRTLLLIGAGSFIGGVARYLLSRGIHLWAGSSLPWGTLAVNVIGCLILGVLYGVFERGAIMDQDMRLALTVGLLAAYLGHLIVKTI
ncbi:MAG TPA: CrcB family protein [Candidatus Alistipes excrementipullorum]|nr:CrcB family protein [Candidatus Alistipes excrementipullorum]